MDDLLPLISVILYVLILLVPVAKGAPPDRLQRLRSAR